MDDHIQRPLPPHAASPQPRDPRPSQTPDDALRLLVGALARQAAREAFASCLPPSDAAMLPSDA